MAEVNRILLMTAYYCTDVIHVFAIDQEVLLKLMQSLGRFT